MKILQARKTDRLPQGAIVLAVEAPGNTLVARPIFGAWTVKWPVGPQGLGGPHQWVLTGVASAAVYAYLSGGRHNLSSAEVLYTLDEPA